MAAKAERSQLQPQTQGVFLGYLMVGENSSNMAGGFSPLLLADLILHLCHFIITSADLSQNQ